MDASLFTSTASQPVRGVTRTIVPVVPVGAPVTITARDPSDSTFAAVSSVYHLGPAFEPSAFHRLATFARPRLVPSTDVALRVDGVKHLVVWFDPATCIPDELDVPDDFSIHVRAALVPPVPKR